MTQQIDLVTFETTSNFESALNACKRTNEYMPTWEIFVNTKFFVPIIQDDNNESLTGFLFSITAYPDSNNPSIIISEQLEGLASIQTELATRLTGAQLIKMLNPGVGVAICTNTPDEDNMFMIPKETVQWLKEGIQEAKIITENTLIKNHNMKDKENKMNQQIDPVKLKTAAEHLEWVCQQYPHDEKIQGLYRGLLPMIEDAKAGRILEAVEDFVPFSWAVSAEGLYDEYKNPRIGSAYVDFATEMEGGLTEQDKRIISKLEERIKAKASQKENGHE